jgi:hypothetical protein
MSGRFSTGVQLKRQHEPNYGGIASCAVFARALDDNSEDEDLRAGKINYVALGEREKEMDEFFVEEDEHEKAEAIQDDYDLHFDGIQQRRRLTFQGDKGDVGLAHQKSVRYMAGIKAAAEKRKREQTINYEKIAAKQMKREGNEFETKGRYMTEGYKEMLKQNQEFAAKDDEQEKWNLSHSVANKNDMTSFYRRMYKQEMTFGGPRGPIIEEKPSNTIEIQLGMTNSDDESEEAQANKTSNTLPEPTKTDLDDQSLIKPEQFVKERSRSASKDRSKKAEISEDKQTTIEKTDKTDAPMSREEKIRLAKERQKQRANQVSLGLQS